MTGFGICCRTKSYLQYSVGKFPELVEGQIPAFNTVHIGVCLHPIGTKKRQKTRWYFYGGNINLQQKCQKPDK